ncbi:hypothetical protein DM02DRAFT_618508 [Periconia macrospinosa]|uniref:ACB domain-containing protein n=1 Tax=Periconia macrospinosa TaxID=97972 RepID=A0A2V1D944_9PLEO|nr:hypothetical protein DM02DRAFT_618508 [Periconia macrospinosa]
MADSVDRVFSHALNTVNKIRTGSQKPPSATRLKLYGLYKQAMEGDVDGIMERPEDNSDEGHRAREKWDAWKQQNGMSRTEAKRHYITTLIETMHKYASPSADSRELVAELEFVWDQVKSNVPSSSSSSPQRTLGSMGLQMPPPSYPQFNTPKPQRKGKERPEIEGEDGPLQIKSPMSQSEEDLEEEEEIDKEEFVDAPDSQQDPNATNTTTNPAKDANVQTDLVIQEPIPYTTPQRPPPRTAIGLLPALFTPTPAPSKPQPQTQLPSVSAADQKWRKRIEQSLIKQTAEIAALREQLEARSLFTHTKKFLVLRFAWRVLWGSVKHIAIDTVILGVVLLWMRRKKDRRLEGAVRVLLGDAVAQVQRVGGAQLGRVKIPGIGGVKK